MKSYYFNKDLIAKSTIPEDLSEIRAFNKDLIAKSTISEDLYEILFFF